MVFGPTGILAYWYIGIGILVYWYWHIGILVLVYWYWHIGILVFIKAKKINLQNYPTVIANFH